MSSTARIVTWSSSSRVTGWSPAPAIAGDRLARGRRAVGKNASSVDRGGGAARSRSVASVMIPSVPWLPTNRCVSA